MFVSHDLVKVITLVATFLVADVALVHSLDERAWTWSDPWILSIFWGGISRADQPAFEDLVMVSWVFSIELVRFL